MAPSSCHFRWTLHLLIGLAKQTLGMSWLVCFEKAECLRVVPSSVLHAVFGSSAAAHAVACLSGEGLMHQLPVLQFASKPADNIKFSARCPADLMLVAGVKKQRSAAAVAPELSLLLSSPGTAYIA